MGRKMIETEHCVADAISIGMSGIEELRDELQEWYDNLPDSLQNGVKGDTLQCSIDALSNVDSLSVPTCVESCTDPADPATAQYIGGLRFKLLVPAPTKRRLSRRERRDEATALLQGALDAMRDAVEDRPELHGTEEDQYAKTWEEITEFCDELGSYMEEFEGAEFPGMYG